MTTQVAKNDLPRPYANTNMQGRIKIVQALYRYNILERMGNYYINREKLMVDLLKESMIEYLERMGVLDILKIPSLISPTPLWVLIHQFLEQLKRKCSHNANANASSIVTLTQVVLK